MVYLIDTPMFCKLITWQRRHRPSSGAGLLERQGTECGRTGLRSMMLKPLVLLFLLGASSALAQPCLKYDPAIVKLKGIIVERKVPNLDDETKVVHYLAIRLAQPACVSADSLSFLGESNNDAESNVRFVQLVDVFEGKKFKMEYARWKGLAKSGAPVTISGRLYHADNGHHHTAVLIQVMDVQETK